MIDDKGRSRCDHCSRFLADRYPYHVCPRCQDRKIASRKLLARVDKMIASWDAQPVSKGDVRQVREAGR